MKDPGLSRLALIDEITIFSECYSGFEKRFISGIRVNSEDVRVIAYKMATRSDLPVIECVTDGERNVQSIPQICSFISLTVQRPLLFTLL